MPLPLAAAIAAGTSILNTGAQLLTNRQNRKNALDDWNRQNAYNSPAQQMQRFKEAGLNPNLIYKQTNESSPVRSTDYVAPQIQEGALDILGKSNNIQVQELNMESMKLRNQNQELQNELLRAQLPDLMDKPSIQNRVANANYDQLIESTNLKRLERSQFPIKTDILEQQLKTLATSNEYQKLNIMQKYDINELLKKQIKAATEGKIQQNTINQFEVDTRKKLDQIIPSGGSGTAQKIMGFLGTIFRSVIRK